MSRTGWMAAVVAIIAVIPVSGVAFARNWTPTVPPEAPTTLVARTSLEGKMVPDPAEGVEIDSLGPSPFGGACLDTIERPVGAMSLCWEVVRNMHDADPEQDYYLLRVHGTFGGDVGTGVRWAAVRARFIGESPQQVIDAWPKDVYDGPCQTVDVSFLGGRALQETLCGRTTGTTNKTDRSQLVTWTCVGCLVPDHADRAIALEQSVGVREGTIPGWEIFADIGD